MLWNGFVTRFMPKGGAQSGRGRPVAQPSSTHPAGTADAPSGTGASVEFRRVGKRYGEVLAVNDVSLTIAPGEFLTLLGPSGSGKSTLLMMLAGFERPSSGDIFVAGRRMTNVPSYRRNQGIVFQNYALFPHMTVLENLRFPLAVRGIPDEESAGLIERALLRVRMPGVEARYPHQLSGGQQQRIALARAIVFEPPVLLMDEPLSALDRKLREEMQLELAALHGELGNTIVYVTHDQNEALTMSDRIALLRDGKVVQLATPPDIYDAPCDAFAAGFVGETNFIAAEVRAQEGARVDVVAAGGHRLLANAETRWPEGSRVTVAVRPESLELTRIDDPAPTEPLSERRLRGRIEQAVFLGEAWRYAVRVGELRLVAKVQSTPRARPFAIGDEVQVGVHATSLRVLGDTAVTGMSKETISGRGNS